jgi:hypothetical protein
MGLHRRDAPAGDVRQLYDRAVAEFGPALAHHTFIFGSDFPQVAEGRCSCAGSNKAISVERDSVGKEQLLEPLPLFERRLDPEVSGAWQNAFREGQDAFHVEFFELAGVAVHARESELLAQLFGVAVVRFDVDRALEQECFVQAVELLLDGLDRALGGCDLVADDCLSPLPDLQH